MLHILFCADNEPDGFVLARRPIWRMSYIEQQRCEMQGQRSSGGSQNQTMDRFVPGGGQGSVCTAYTALSAALK